MKFRLKTGLMLALLPLLSNASLAHARKKLVCYPEFKSALSVAPLPENTQILPPLALSKKCAAVITNNSEGISSLSVFGFNNDCCMLSAEPTQSPFSFSGQANVVEFSHNGKLLAVATADNHLYVFKINKCCTFDTNAQVITLPSNTSNPTGLSFSPNNKCIAISFSDSSNVAVYPIHADCSVGPDPIGPALSTGGTPVTLAYSPKGDCLAVLNYGPSSTSSVSFFSVNALSCILTPVPHSPFSTNVSNDGTPLSLTFSPSGECLTVVTAMNPDYSNNFGALSIFSVKNCIPTLVNVVPSGGIGATGAAYSKNGGCLIVSNFFASINAFSVDTCCKICPQGTFNPGQNVLPIGIKSKDNCVVTVNVNESPVNPYIELRSYKLKPCQSADHASTESAKVVNQDSRFAKAFLLNSAASKLAEKLKEKMN